jgi:hypothetical protein
MLANDPAGNLVPCHRSLFSGGGKADEIREKAFIS